MYHYVVDSTIFGGIKNVFKQPIKYVVDWQRSTTTYREGKLSGV